MTASNNGLGYIVIDGEEGRFRGASLVVDLRGIPVDFRYTDLIRPTKLERILYGSALDVYLREELILQSLLGAVETKPQVWICDAEELLAPIKALEKAKCVVLSASTHAPLESAGSVEPMGGANVVLIQADAVSAPLRATFSEGVRQDEVQQTASLLTDAARTMELLEPFGRIRKALTSLGEE